MKLWLWYGAAHFVTGITAESSLSSSLQLARDPCHCTLSFAAMPPWNLAECRSEIMFAFPLCPSPSATPRPRSPLPCSFSFTPFGPLLSITLSLPPPPSLPRWLPPKKAEVASSAGAFLASSRSLALSSPSPPSRTQRRSFAASFVCHPTRGAKECSAFSCTFLQSKRPLCVRLRLMYSSSFNRRVDFVNFNL